MPTSRKKQNPPDRRVKKTRLAIREALVALMMQKGYEAIIVEDILERADVGRSTFYAHFADKEDVLRSGIEAFRQGLEQHRMTAASDTHWPFAFSLELLRHAGSKKGLYRALVGRQSGTLVLGIFRDFSAVRLGASRRRRRWSCLCSTQPARTCPC